jgi:protein TonB
MVKSFGKSILTSTAIHVVAFLLIFQVLGNFLVSRQPAFMELTLIGVSSRGDGKGAQATLRGEDSGAPAAADTGKGEVFSSPKAASAPAVKEPPPDGDVSLNRPTPKPASDGKAERAAYLETLRRDAPIGIAPKGEQPDRIKTTAGLGYMGVAGTPNGRVDIEGELAGRGIRRKVVPSYPEWAKKQGVEGTIQYRVIVLPSGYLRDDVQLEQTSGWRELDRVAYGALLQWEFDPLPAEAPQALQSGIVTFTFSFKSQP